MVQHMMELGLSSGTEQVHLAATWVLFFLSGQGLPLEISADEDRVVCSCISIPIASSAMPKSLCLPEAKRSPLFSRGKGGEWRFCQGRPGG